jgi:hypothetical protein
VLCGGDLSEATEGERAVPAGPGAEGFCRSVHAAEDAWKALAVDHHQRESVCGTDETSLSKKTVEFKVVQSLFGKASERNRTLITKAVNLSIPHYRDVEDVYLGLFINTQEGEQPFHVIGVKSKEPIDRFQDSLMMNLRKDYYKHVRFEIMALDSSDVSTKLIEQGNHLKILNS